MSDLLQYHRRRRALIIAASITVSVVAPAVSRAQADWPTKPIRFIAAMPPGGPSDLVLRRASEKMQPALKQALVLENKPGANGNLGAGEVARAAPDGYTWLWATDTTVTVNPWVYRTMPFKSDDLVPVIRASTMSQTLVCHQGLGLKKLEDFVKLAKSRNVTYASGGSGSPGHLTTERFSHAAGIQLTHVPYKGPAPAMQDVIGGQVDCGFLAGATVLPFVRSGRLVALAVSGAKRSPQLPEVPTIAESGFAGFESEFALVLFAPRNTPQAIVDRMHAAMADALRKPDVVETLRANDLDVVATTQAQTAMKLGTDARDWGSLVKRIGLQQD